MSGPEHRQVTYHLQVIETSPTGSRTIYHGTGNAFVLAVGTLAGTRLTADVDHQGNPAVCQRLVDYIDHALHNPPPDPQR